MLKAFDGLEASHRKRIYPKGAGQGAIQRIFDERALAGTGYTGDADEHAERQPDDEIFQIMFVGSSDDEHLPVAGPAGFREWNVFLSPEVAGREGALVLDKLFGRGGADYLAAPFAGLRPEFDEIVG